MRLVDFLKVSGKTAFLTSLTQGGSSWEQTEIGISSIVDTWLLLRDIELGGERNRGLYVLKSRGMAHSNQIREFLLTSDGIKILDVYVGPEGVLTGSMRMAQEARLRDQHIEREQELERKQRIVQQKCKSLEAQIAALEAELASETAELAVARKEAALQNEQNWAIQRAMANSRKADARPSSGT
jgi:circadian clock protein KaiC